MEVKDPNQTKKPNAESVSQRPASQPARRRPALTIDYALYEHYLTEADLSDAQKRAFLDTLWSIITAFVDLGYGVHPIQQSAAPEICGQVETSSVPDPDAPALVVDCFAQSTAHPTTVTARQSQAQREES